MWVEQLSTSSILSSILETTLLGMPISLILPSNYKCKINKARDNRLLIALGTLFLFSSSHLCDFGPVHLI